MIMCYNFFVVMCSRCSELIHEVITMGEKLGISYRTAWRTNKDDSG